MDDATTNLCRGALLPHIILNCLLLLRLLLFLQYADLGRYGTFDLEISADDGTMKWSSSLQNIKMLETELNVTISSLNYHLHQQWTDNNTDVAIGGVGCGPNITGNHYDPFFGCGPASGVPTDQCLAIGKAKNATRYNCNPAVYGSRAYNECEVGDLSGKNGVILVTADGRATSTRAIPDPLPVIAAQYVTDRTVNKADQFASIVYHIGSPRVLCGKLLEGKRPAAPPTTPATTPAPVMVTRPPTKPTASPVVAYPPTVIRPPTAPIIASPVVAYPPTAIRPPTAPIIASPVVAYPPTGITGSPCGIDYFLYNSDTNKPVGGGPLITGGRGNPSCNDDDFSFNIEARPTGNCAALTRSVRLKFTAPGRKNPTTATESTKPYLLFGNNAKGRKNLGSYFIMATFFTGRHGAGQELFNETVEIKFVCE
jgi:hypothetical protein